MILMSMQVEVVERSMKIHSPMIAKAEVRKNVEVERPHDGIEHMGNVEF